MTLESVAHQTDHFADAFVLVRTVMALRRHYDVRTFTADAILIIEIKCKRKDILKKDILMLNGVFSANVFGIR